MIDALFWLAVLFSALWVVGCVVEFVLDVMR
jgi:hypothetical protein